MMNSKCGKSLTNTVLKKTALRATAIVISKACQLRNTKSGWCMITKLWICKAVR